MSTISWELVEDKNGSGTPNYGDVVKPVIDTDAQTPWVLLEITNSDGKTDVRWQGMFDGALGDQGRWPLYGSQYQGGPAHATFSLWDEPFSLGAKRKGKTPQPLASVSFDVAA